jgi:hypothetical protein
VEDVSFMLKMPEEQIMIFARVCEEAKIRATVLNIPDTTDIVYQKNMVQN